MTAPGEHVSDRWARWRAAVDLDAYDARWAAMAARGEAVHGEADFVMRFSPSSALDAGCGTGRVGIELARRGVAVVGVDLDADMVARARRKAPEIEWHTSDLAEVDLARLFDVVVMAGNVLLFCDPSARRPILANLGNHLGAGGRLIAGMSIEPGYSLDDFDADAAAGGLSLAERWSTWDAAPFEGGDYHVSVLQRGAR